MHLHEVTDKDARYIIDKDTREISLASGSDMIMQYDHNSERLTFEIPRNIEGHDLMGCDSVQIHYLNIDSATKESNADVYEVDDMAVDEGGNTITLSWLISKNATQYAGPLNFVVIFKCTTDGAVDYRWGTAIYKGLTVNSGMDNGEGVVEEYADILEQWKADLEVNSVKTVNGAEPDENGNVEIETGGVSSWNDLTDKPFYEEGGIVTILEETTITASDFGEIDYQTDERLNIVGGNEYIVKWNGTDYKVIAESFTIDGMVLDVIGNSGDVGGNDTTSPFTIMNMPTEISSVTSIVGVDLVTAYENITISILENGLTIHPLPQKYLPENIRSDWNQNDETASDYVKNRPFYEKTVVKTILEETTFTYSTEFVVFTPLADIEVGAEYTVVWNGVTYVCVSFAAEGYGIVIGDGSLVFGTENTGEPFCIVCTPQDNMYGFVPLDGSTTVTMSIVGTIVEIQQIDKKYLPNIPTIGVYDSTTDETQYTDNLIIANNAECPEIQHFIDTDGTIKTRNDGFLLVGNIESNVIFTTSGAGGVVGEFVECDNGAITVDEHMARVLSMGTASAIRLKDEYDTFLLCHKSVDITTSTMTFSGIVRNKKNLSELSITFDGVANEKGVLCIKAGLTINYTIASTLMTV